MFATSVRAPLAAVFVTALCLAAATPTLDDEETSRPVETGSAAVFQKRMEFRKEKIQEYFWRMLMELVPLLHPRDSGLPKQLLRKDELPTRGSHSITLEKKKVPYIEEENEREDKDLEGTEEDYLDTETVQKEDDLALSKHRDASIKEQPPKHEDNDDNAFEEATSEYDYRPEDDAMKDVFLEMDGQNPTSSTSPASLQKPQPHSVKVHHLRFKVKKSPRLKPRHSLSSRRGGGAPSSRRTLPSAKPSAGPATHSRKGHMKQNSSPKPH